MLIAAEPFGNPETLGLDNGWTLLSYLRRFAALRGG
jgi:hypothetical protein